MIQALRSEATKTEDTFSQLQEIQESVRLAFLNCLLDFAGTMDVFTVLTLFSIIRKNL